MITAVGLFLIDALFTGWAISLVALPFVTLVGLWLGKRRPAQARVVNLLAFGMAVGCGVFIASTALASRFIDLRLTSMQSMLASVILFASLALTIPCALIAARLAVIARRTVERRAARGLPACTEGSTPNLRAGL